MVDIDKVGSVFRDAPIGFDVGDDLIIVVQRFGADVMVAYQRMYLRISLKRFLFVI